MLATAQQSALEVEIVEGTSNILVEARAGTGKTTSLRRMALALLANSVKAPTIAVAAYNTKIAKEIEGKFIDDGINATVRTFHSFGLTEWRKVSPGVKIEGMGEGKAGCYKFDRIVIEQQIPAAFHAFVQKAVSLAKQRAIGVVCRIDHVPAWLEMVDHFDLEDLLYNDEDAEAARDAMAPAQRQGMIQEALQWSCKALMSGNRMAKEVIDFDDMIYMPLIAQVKITQYDLVLVDEAQDTNPARREFARRMVAPTGRIVFVGDPYQAIYGFTGADNDALDVICQQFACKRMPLTMTFRCGKAIVAEAKMLVPDYEAFEGNPEGSVSSVSFGDFNKMEMAPGQDAILCRNTKPLIDVAYSLIRRGVPVHVEGRDIGRDLLKLVNRWKRVKSLSTLETKLRDYREKEIAKLIAKGHDLQADAVADRVDTVFAIIAGMGPNATLEGLRTRISSLFEDLPDGQKIDKVILMTVHRSKGLEFDRVFLLGRNRYMPSRYARQPWQLDQERNLEYVALTRAINTLVEVVV